MINHCLKILLRNSNNKLWSILSFIMIFLYPYSIHCRNSFVPTKYIPYSEFRDLKDMEYQRRIQCLDSNEAGQWVTVNNNGETQFKVSPLSFLGLRPRFLVIGLIISFLISSTHFFFSSNTHCLYDLPSNRLLLHCFTH